MSGRQHFLKVIPKDEALGRWFAQLRPEALGVERVPLESAHGRVLAEDVAASIDLPPFDRAVVDGFAVQAKDTFEAEETKPARLGLEARTLAAGDDARGVEVRPGRAVEIATGAPIPRGANAVVMVEVTEKHGQDVLVARGVTPGEGIQLAGSDVRRGEALFARGTRLGARETCVLAAQGVGEVPVFRRPRVAVISTGDELVAPGAGPLQPGQIFDSNARLLADLVREHGGEPVVLPRARDSLDELRRVLEQAKAHDVVVLSGGTSKGAGDLTFRLLGELGEPGILVHGVALKPGKPTVLGAWGRQPVVVLPGFPSSCAITFDVFVKPLVRILAGLEPEDARGTRDVKLALAAPAGQGRHEYVLVNVVASSESPGDLLAYPLLKGSGSVASFAQAEGFVEVPPGRERVERGERLRATLWAPDRRVADLVLAASPDPGLDALVRVAREAADVRIKVIALSSRLAGEAVARGESDVALIPVASGSDPKRALPLGASARLVAAYARKQVLAARPGTLAGLGETAARVLAAARGKHLRLVSRHPGSVTRTLLDSLLDEAAKQAGVAPADLRAGLAGLDDLARSHEGVAAAIAGGSADLGLCLESVARARGLDVLPVREEHVFLGIAKARGEDPKVARLVSVLASPAFAAALGGRPGLAALALAPRPGA